MRTRVKRLTALLLALLIGLMGLGWAAAEDDWRSMLRELYGLSDDAPDSGNASGGGTRGKGTEDSGAGVEDRFELPVTDPQQIVNYLDLYGELPDNFITKDEARDLGWDSRYNYVGEVAPGKSIGGDRFGNYEGQLPKKKGRQWYECDANYRGKKRGPERVLFSSDGLYYYTDDHYQTFIELFPEDAP